MGKRWESAQGEGVQKRRGEREGEVARRIRRGEGGKGKVAIGGT